MPTKPTTPMPEWHDARISELSIQPLNRVLIRFGWMEAYQHHDSGDQPSAAWSATLTLTGVSALRGLEPGIGGGWVIDGRLVDRGGRETNDASHALGGADIHAIELTLNNGDKLWIECQHVELSLDGMVKTLDDWPP